MPLRGYLSLCEERQKIIISRDKGNISEHRAENDNRNLVAHYRIDGNVITKGLRCDFLLLNEDKGHAYFIELKGSDIEHGIRQLEQTASIMQARLTGYEFRYRLVISRARTHKINGISYKRFKKEHPGKDEFRCEEVKLTEKI